MARMVGKARQPVCGRDCCGDVPGSDRKRMRRTAKRSERNQWKKDINA